MLDLVDLNNQDESPHEVEVVVRIGNEILQWDSYQIDADTGNANRAIEFDAPVDPEDFSVAARLNDGNTAWTDDSGAEFLHGVSEGEPGCFWIEIRITEDAELRMIRYKEQLSKC